jgi:CRISPR-associated protein Csh1
MIKTLYNIGKILREEYPEWFTPWKDPFPGNDESNKIIVVIEVEDMKVKDEPTIEEYKKANVEKYLYREAKQNATNLVPTFYLQVKSNKELQKEENAKKIKKIEASLKNYKHDFLRNGGIDKVAKILNELELNNHNNYLLTFRIDGKYFGEFEKYKKLFYEDAFNKYSNASKSESNYCSVTYSQNNEVWGRVSTLGFAVTDQAFSRNGFDTDNSYKMFPVSPDAVKILDGVKDFVINNLSQGFSKLNYFILPHFININEEIQKELLDSFFLKVQKAETSSFDESKSIIGFENLIYEVVEDENLSQSGIYYDIFFYQINNAQFLIKLHLSDVLPSQFGKIFKVKGLVEKRYDIITRSENKDEIFHYYLNLKNIKDFFSYTRQREIIFHPFFYKVIEAIFYNSALNEETVINFLLGKIVSDFNKRYENKFLFPQTFKKSLVIYQFISGLKLFKNKKIMGDNSIVALTMDEFIEQTNALFDSDYAKGVFMLGCLVKKLLKIQYNNLKSTPFDKRLNNLNLDNKELQRIFRETKSKLTQYGDSYNLLEAKIFGFLSDQNKTEKLTRDKISYLFSGGLVMEEEFSREAKRRKKIEEEKNKQITDTEN